MRLLNLELGNIMETFTMFVLGSTYRRTDLHKSYGGQRQGGISTPSGRNFILLFTGEQGEQYGYWDGWTEEVG